MKYFNKFDRFKKLYEASEFGFSIFSLFKPFSGLLTKIKYTVKLTNIVNNYDAYLYDVYVEYLNRKKNLPTDGLGETKIAVIGEDETIHLDKEEDFDLRCRSACFGHGWRR